MKKVSILTLVLAVILSVKFVSGALLTREQSAASAAPPGLAATLVVTSAADSGPGTLRQALLDAQSGDTITFDPAIFPPTAPVTITLSTTATLNGALPNVSQGNLTIDASNAGVILDGSQLPGNSVNGLEIYGSSGNTVRGLQVVNFTSTGITLCGGSHNTIGGDRNTGTGPLGQGNLVSNNNIGIDLCVQESFTTLEGNLIGTDPTGTKDWGNVYCGILVENEVHDTMIGPDNIVAFNRYAGILVDGPGASGNTITQNSIHHNQSKGIELRDGGNTMLDSPLISEFDMATGTVTGTACANCTVEVFSDSGGEGEVYEGQTKADSAGAFAFEKGTSFTGPRLTATATDSDGNTSEFSEPTYAAFIVTSSADNGPGTLRQALLDAQSGDTITFDPAIFPPTAPVTITLNSTASPNSALPHVSQGNLTIDASNAGVILDGSHIPGDTVNALEVYGSDGNTIRGLQIVNFTGTGIMLGGSSNNTIGGDRSIGTGPMGQGNLISNNSIGIILFGQGSSATVKGNLIGTDPTGTKDWGNASYGIWVENEVRGTMIGPDNTVAYNEYFGILVDGPGAFGNTITHNSIHSNADKGISLTDGGNMELPAPAIVAVTIDLISGSTVIGTACASCTVEVFTDGEDEGRTFLGTATADVSGDFAFTGDLHGAYITATATDSLGNTSEFSSPVSFMLHRIYLPLMTKSSSG